MTSTYSITDDVVYPIGRPELTRTTFQNTDNVYDVAVGGEPFFLAASDRYPYHRETASYKRQQLDLTQQPGEQTFEGWWLRSQSSWHFGAGINFLEPLQGDTVIYRYKKSVGIDPWTPGQISLLPAVTPVAEVSDNICLIGAIDSANESVVFLSDDAVLKRITASGTSATVTYGGSGSNITSLTQDGTNYYAANATGIYKGALTGAGSGTKIWDTGSTKVVINWVKQRLFAGIGASLYELVGTGPTLPSAVYTHPNTNWTWTAIAEGPNAIYVSGFAGTASAIYKLTISDTNGGVPTLTSAVTAADFPDEEHVTSIGTYLGKYILIGTNKGVRVGIISADGSIVYGGLTYEHNNNTHITNFAFRDRFAYATVTNDIDGKSGLIRIDLSQPVSEGLYAWATDLHTDVTGFCRGVAYIGETGRLAFVIADDYLYFQHATNLVQSGYIDTGFIRYNTLEKKHFKLVKVRVANPLNGAVGVSTITKDGNVNSIITLPTDAVADQDLSTNLLNPQEQLAFRFTLYRNDSDATLGAEVIGFQTKALPANKRNRTILVPLMCYDFEQDRNGIMVGYDGRAWNRLANLETIESNGDTVIFQDFTNGEQVEGLIEKVTFDRMSPPDRRFQGFGGIIYVTIRTV